MNSYAQNYRIEEITDLLRQQQIVFIGEDHKAEELSFTLTKNLLDAFLYENDTVTVCLERPFSEAVILNYILTNKKYDEVYTEYLDILKLRGFKSEIKLYNYIYNQYRKNSKVIRLNTIDIESSPETLAFELMFFLNDFKLNSTAYKNISNRDRLFSLSYEKNDYLKSDKILNEYINSVKNVFFSSDTIYIKDYFGTSIYNNIKRSLVIYNREYLQPGDMNFFLYQREMIIFDNFKLNSKTLNNRTIAISGAQHLSRENTILKEILIPIPFVSNFVSTTKLNNYLMVYFLCDKDYKFRKIKKMTQRGKAIYSIRFEKSDERMVYIYAIE